MFTDDYADVFAGDERWKSLETPDGDTFAWDEDSTYVRRPPYFDGMPQEPEPVEDIEGARVLLKLGDSVTTDHISPAGAIKKDSPAGSYLREHGVEQRDFNSYGSRRGNHEIMIRGTFANIRLRNQLAPGTEGGFTRDFTQGEGDDAPTTSVYEASENYQEAGTPLVVLSGKEYGSGSSRDWAAKGTALLGVKAVIAESYERIHRSNLIGMGVLPLQYPEGENAESLGLTGEETFSITGVTELNEGSTPRTVKVKAGDTEFDAVGPHRHPRRGGLLPPRRDHAVRPALPAHQVAPPPACNAGLWTPRKGHDPCEASTRLGRMASAGVAVRRTSRGGRMLGLTPLDLGVIVTALLVGAVVQSVVGLGLGLVAAPVVTLVEPSVMPELMLWLAVAMPLVTLAGEREDIDWRGLAWAFPPRLVGTVGGVAVVVAAPDRLIGVAVGVMVLVAVLLTWRTVRIPVNRPTLVTAGLVSGVTGTATSIGGPPLAILYQHRPPREIRTTMAVYFLGGAALSLVGLTVVGEVNTHDALLALAMVPVLLVGLRPARRSGPGWRPAGAAGRAGRLRRLRARPARA